MPAWDMSWADLQDYAGTNPRPIDHDEYWADALAELERQPVELVIEPADTGHRSAQCAHLWFTGIGGARIHAKYVRPHDAVEAPGVALFHGYTGRSHDWFELLAYAAEGFVVVAMDCRGQAGLSEDAGGTLRHTLTGHIVRGLLEGPRHLLFRSVFCDLVRVARILRELPGVDPDRIAASGMSQGGGLALACAALEPSVAAVASVFPFLCDYRRVWELDLAQDAYAELRDWLRMFDPTHERVDETFTTLGYIDVQHLAPRIRGEVLLVTALMDKICPPSTQFAAYNKIVAPKRLVAYPDYEHENLPEVDDRVVAFLREALRVG